MALWTEVPPLKMERTLRLVHCLPFKGTLSLLLPPFFVSLVFVGGAPSFNCLILQLFVENIYLFVYEAKGISLEQILFD